MRQGTLRQTGARARLVRGVLTLLILLLAGTARAQTAWFNEPVAVTQNSIEVSWYYDEYNPPWDPVAQYYDSSYGDWVDLNYTGDQQGEATGLEPNTSYDFWIFDRYNWEPVGWGTFSTASDEEPPPEEGTISLWITAMARYKMKVDWGLNDTGTFDHFEIRYRTHSPTDVLGDWITRGRATSEETMFMVNDLEPGNRYDFQVTGVYESGGRIDSEILTGLAEPPPVAVKLELDSADPQHNVRITWTQPNKEYFQYYEIYRSVNGGAWTLLPQITDPNQEEYVDAGLAEGTLCKYCMWMYNGVANSWPTAYSIRTGAPSEIQLLLNRDNHVDIKFRDTAVGGNYVVERSLYENMSGATTINASHPANGYCTLLTVHDSGTANDTQYYYRVRKSSNSALNEMANIRTSSLTQGKRMKLGTLASFMANYWSDGRWPKLASALNEFMFDLVEIELMIYPAVMDGKDWYHFPAPIDDANSIKDRLELIDNRFRSLSWPVEYIYSTTRAHFASALRILDNRTNPTKWEKVLDLEDKQGVPAGEQGFHRLDPVAAWFADVEANEATGGKLLQGFDYVEQDIDHSFKSPDGKLLDSAMTYVGGGRLTAPALIDTDSLNNSSSALDISAKYNDVVYKLSEISSQYPNRRLNARLNFPDLFHMYAAAGWDINFKYLKENLNTVVSAIALGAALEYRNDGIEVGSNIDLFGTRNYRQVGDFQYVWDDPDHETMETNPGHKPDALYSALLMGYGLGLDRSIVESFDYTECEDDGTVKLNPDNTRNETLIGWNVVDDDMYDANNVEQKTIEYHKTAHGNKFLEFRDKYANVRPQLDWRDYRPKVAIIRIPDGNWGLRGSIFDYVGDSYNPLGSRTWLFGSKNFWAHQYQFVSTSTGTDITTNHTTNDTLVDYKSEEWLHAWSLLTGHSVNGFVKPGAINLFNTSLYYKQTKLPDGTTDYQVPFLQPMDSVAVFDHLVYESKIGSDVWGGINCFVVTGHALSQVTAQAIDDRLQDTGLMPAKCIIDRALFEANYVTWSDPTNPAKFTILDPYGTSATDYAFAWKDARGFPMYTETLKTALEPYMPKDQYKAVFRYLDKAVVFSRVSDGIHESDRIKLNVYPIGLIGQMYNRLNPANVPPNAPIPAHDLDMDGSLDSGTEYELYDLNNDSVFNYQDLVTLCDWLGESAPGDPGE